MSHSHASWSSTINGVKNSEYGSYQSILSTTTSTGTLGGRSQNDPASTTIDGANKWRPMEYLTSQQRKHNLLVITLLCVFVALLCGLAVWWILCVESEHSADLQSSSSLLDGENVLNIDARASRNERRIFAQQAMDRLNRHTRLYTLESKCECTLMVLRHCEKWGADDDDDDDEYDNNDATSEKTLNGSDKHCSYLGMERAAFLPTLFDANNSHTTTNDTTRTGENDAIVFLDTPHQHWRRRWPAPVRLYALSTDRNAHANFREWETLVPLSKSVGVEIELVPKGNDFAMKHFFPLLQSGDLCGRLVVVSWKHSIIPSLVNSVGCGPDNGCPDSYPEDSFDQVWQLKFVFDPPNLQYGDTLPPVAMGDTTDTATPPSEPGNRQLKHFHHHRNYQYPSHHRSSNINGPPVADDKSVSALAPQWAVYASVTQQFFDPLAYSNSVGDYYHSTSSGSGNNDGDATAGESTAPIGGKWWNPGL